MKYETMTREDILTAQRAWGAAVEAGDVEALLALYDFDNENGPILFKPTMATEIRTDRAGARSYFVGGDERYPDDAGFLGKGWISVVFHSAAGAVFEAGGAAANDMGKYVFEDKAGNAARADYTFSYHKVGGRVLITLHHSSFVYIPE